MSVETLSSDPSKHLIPIEGDPEIGVYKPTLRVLRSLGRAAAANDFLLRTASGIESGDRPEPPQHSSDSTWAEDEILQIAA